MYKKFQVRTHFARPNWKKVFSRACSRHPYAKIGWYQFKYKQIHEYHVIYLSNLFDFFCYCSLSILGVFYCGAPVLAQELKKLCYEFNQKGTTKFEFHKEHY